jgi:hypothetical protein
MNMRRPVVLIPISQHFTLRYLTLTPLFETLRKSLDCRLALGWSDEELAAEMESGGAPCHAMPRLECQPVYRAFRNWALAMWEADMGSPTPAIDRRRMRAINRSARFRFYYWRNDVRDAAARACARVRPLRRAVEAMEDRLFRSSSNRHAFARLIEQVRPDIVLSITPFVSSEAVLCRVARDMGVKVVASVLSFDNLTSRGKIEVAFDHYGVWNAFMQREAVRIYGVDEKQVEIVGAPQMDFYGWRDFLPPRTQWLAEWGLEAGRPVVLFGAGPPNITTVEPAILGELDRIVDSWPAAARPQILLRLHPVDDRGRWTDSLRKCRHVTVASSWRVRDNHAGRIALEDVRALASTLAYTSVHVSTSSTMSLDGAIFDKPQIGLAYDPGGDPQLDRAMRELYEREHFQPLTRSGAIRLVRSSDELAEALRDSLAYPEQGRAERGALTRQLLGVPVGSAATAVAGMVLRVAGLEKSVEIPKGHSTCATC